MEKKQGMAHLNELLGHDVGSILKREAVITLTGHVKLILPLNFKQSDWLLKNLLFK